MASTLTWSIVVIIVRAFISVSVIHLLSFWWVLSLILRFSFRFTSASGLFWFCTFKQLRYITLFFVHCCTCCPGPGLSFCMYLLGSLGNTVYLHYHIVYDFVVVHSSDSGNSETDIDYIEVFVLYFGYQSSKWSVSALTIIRSVALTLI